MASGAQVANGAFVGPNARVLSGKVGATARIEDHAVVLGGTVDSGTVGGVSIVLPGFTVSGSARVALAWPYGPGWFERPVSIAGNAQYLGDLELRGAGTNKGTGRFCGFADGSTADNCSQADVTAAPPYHWR